MAKRMATIAAQQGGRYVRQLASHWSHKFTVDVEKGDVEKGDVESGDDTVLATIHFPTATVTLKADTCAIHATIDSDSDVNAEQLTEVVARHIDRFAFREAPLMYDWRAG